MSPEPLESPAEPVSLIPVQEKIQTLEASKHTEATITGEDEETTYTAFPEPLEATGAEKGLKNVTMNPEALGTSQNPETVGARKAIPITPTYSPKKKASKFTSLHKSSLSKSSTRKVPYPKGRPSAPLSLRPTIHTFPHTTPPHLLSPALIASSSFPRHLHRDTYTTYQLQYRFLPTTLPLPFSFHVFLGPLPVDEDWFNSNSRVGGHGIAAGHTGKSAISGRVPLTRLLLDRLGGLDEEVVVPYLKRELKWIFERDNGGGVPVELGELEGVRVRIASARVNISEVKDPQWIFYESEVGGTRGRLKG